jgi:hypothetical protein
MSRLESATSASQAGILARQAIAYDLPWEEVVLPRPAGSCFVRSLSEILNPEYPLRLFR